MTTPRKHEILGKAKSIALERQIRAGLPAITPSESELKETGTYQEAQIDLMRVDQEALSEQRRYLNEMADDLRLKIIPKRGLSVLKKETGYEWTNGWTKHDRKPKAKRKPKPKPQKPREPIIHRITREVRKLPSIKALGEVKPKKPKKVPCPYCDEIVTLTKRGLISGSHMIQHKRVKEKWISTSPKPKPKKRKKSHVERSGKTMRVLRKIDGVKVFSFPDDVWKIRKPKRRKKK